MLMDTLHSSLSGALYPETVGKRGTYMSHKASQTPHRKLTERSDLFISVTPEVSDTIESVNFGLMCSY